MSIFIIAIIVLIIIKVKLDLKKEKKVKEIEKNFEEEFQFDKKYSKKIYALYEKYVDITDYIYDYFTPYEDKNNYSKRIQILDKAIKKYQEFKDFCYSLGELGIKEFNSYNVDKGFEKIPLDFYDNLGYNKLDENFEYISPYEKCDFENINFLKYLLNQYSQNKEEAIKFIKDDEKAYKIFYYGGITNYNNEKYREEFIKKLPKNLIKFIRKNEGVLQKDIYSYFPAEFKSAVQKTLLSLVEKGKVERTRSGHTFKLTVKQEKSAKNNIS